MANKNDNTIFWIIGIIFLIIVIAPQFLEQEEDIELNTHYYKDGVEVFSQKGFFDFSVVKLSEKNVTAIYHVLCADGTEFLFRGNAIGFEKIFDRICTNIAK